MLLRKQIQIITMVDLSGKQDFKMIWLKIIIVVNELVDNSPTFLIFAVAIRLLMRSMVI
jgi:hypothetical protein